MSSTTEPAGSVAGGAGLAERRFRAMGSDVHLLVAPGDLGGTEVVALLDAARDRVEALEQRWSRFRPDSEVSLLNAGDGGPRSVSPETVEVIALALEGWERTSGRFDPTVHDVLVAEGYDRSFDTLTSAAPIDAGGPIGGPVVELVGDRDGPPRAVPGADRIVVDPLTGTVALGAGVHLDLGGIGKGRAADLLAGELVAAGAAGACVNLGGDVAVAGEGPDGGGWVLAVDHPLARDTDLTVVVLATGALVTSSAARRRWVGPRGTAHHLIDPSTGRPGDAGLVAVTVVAGSAAWAEIVAKAAFLAGPDDGARLVTDLGADALLTTTTGEVVRTPGFGAFEVTGSAADGEAAS